VSRRLSTCGTCGGTIERYYSEIQRREVWRHVRPTPNGHTPDPDDSWVSGPDEEPEEE
jgi:hypothetical protein